MRSLRILKQGVWYQIRTRINNREPLFRRSMALSLFARVFRETKLRFAFEIRGLHLVDDWLTFYIRPADGLELPAIMKWLKQVFAVRYNHAEGRIGHIWGDRYWSRIVEGEPPLEEECPEDLRGDSDIGVRPRHGGSGRGVRPQHGRSGRGFRPRHRGSGRRVRPWHGKKAVTPRFPPLFPLPAAPGPG